MKILHGWLKDFLGDAIPSAEAIADLLTFHSFEIDGIEKVGGHEVIDVDVLPNRGSDCLCHRGIARELATLLERELIYDPFRMRPGMPKTDKLKISIENPIACRHFDLALLKGIKIGESPAWLKERLLALGQRSINNVVDATNYIMLSLGQPLHAYDAKKLTEKEGVLHIGVRMGRDKEEITTLTGETYKVDESVQLIVDGHTDTPLGLAGVKGGKQAEIDEHTEMIVLEAASFDPQITRKTSQKLRLQTDASKRFENNVSSEVAPYALHECVELILKIAGGTPVGYAHEHPTKIENPAVTVELARINALLGISLDTDAVESIFERLGFTFEVRNGGWSVIAPLERTDILLEEDVIEEVGRIYGYEHVQSIVPEPALLGEVNARHYYSEKVRNVLIELGFSEVITSSFCKKDEIKLLNALASDKGYLRSTLRKNIAEVLERNVPNMDLLGLTRISVFEIGTVFRKAEGGKGIDEEMMVALGVRTKQSGNSPKDDEILEGTLKRLEQELNNTVNRAIEKGIAEFSLSKLLEVLPQPEKYDPHQKSADIIYKPFSTYPFISRDIALWVPENVTGADVEAVLNVNAGELRVRTTLFDEFKKDGRISYAFRLVFQSYEKTLTDAEVNAIMDHITRAVSERGWEVR